MADDGEIFGNLPRYGKAQDDDGRQRKLRRRSMFYEPEGPLPPRPSGKGGPSINQSAAGGVAWTPAQLPGLVAWYDAQNASTITLNGSTVAQWNDQSGHGYNATQGTAANQPTLNNTGLNGHPALTFNGTSNYMSASCPVGQFPNTFAWYGIISLSVNTDSPFSRAIGGQPAPYLIYGANHTVYIGNSSLTAPDASASYQNLPASPSLFGALYTISGDTYTEWTSGTQSHINSSFGGAAAYGDYATTVTLGSRPDLASWYSGLTGELVFASALAPADRQSLEGYLAWKWGLAGLLPAGHPYKANPPGGTAPPLLTGAESDGTNLYPIGGPSFADAAFTVAPSIVAPDGTTGAVQKMNEGGNNTRHIMYDIGGSTTPTMTMSVYAKPAGRQYLQLQVDDAAGHDCSTIFDVLNGVITEIVQQIPGVITAASIQQGVNGFWKCSVSVNTTVSAAGVANFEYGTSNVATTGSFVNVAYQGDGSSGLYLWRIKETTP